MNNDTKEVTVKVVRISSVDHDKWRKYKVTVTTVEVMEFTVYPETCERCGAKTPELSRNDALFIHANREESGDTCSYYPQEQGTEHTRCCYPVNGWSKVLGKLLCADCTREVMKFINT